MNRSFYIDVKHWNKIIDYARAANKLFNTEIGGMLIALEDKEGDWELMNPVILTQDVTAASTVLEKEELAEYYNSIAMNKKYGPKTQFVWWHSHNTMKAYFSSTDTNTMLEYKGGRFSMSLVVNIEGSYVFRVSVWDPVVAYEELELDILGQERTLSKSILKEVEAKCTKPVTTALTTWKNGKKVTRKSHYTSSDQLELDDYNSGFYGRDHQETIDTDTYNSLFEAMDEINTDYVKGTLNYDKWLEKVKILNRQLKQRRSIYSVPEISNNELEHRVYFNHPHEFIQGHAYEGYLGGHF